MKIRCIIVDDEPLAMEVLEDHIAHFPNLILMKKCGSALVAMEYLHNHSVDLMFLDIKMPRITGTDFLASLHSPPQVVFTTAHREFALDGYDFNIVDFLLKPISLERFARAIDKVLEVTKIQQDVIRVKSNIEREIFVRSGTKMIRVNLSDIRVVEGMKDYLKLHRIQGKTIVVKRTMKAMEEELEAYGFIRVHKSFIVSKKHIQTVLSSRLYIGDHIVPIGRSYAQFVRKYLANNQLNKL